MAFTKAKIVMAGLAVTAVCIVAPQQLKAQVPEAQMDGVMGQSIEDETAQAESDAEEIRKPENVVSLLQVDPIELEFGYGIIPLADVNQGGDLLDRVVMIRRQIALELGTVVPIIRLRDNIQLNPNQYIIKIKGIQVTEGEILFDHYMAMNPGYVEEEITGIPTFEPSFHLPAIWISESKRERVVVDCSATTVPFGSNSSGIRLAGVYGALFAGMYIFCHDVFYSGVPA